jgi:hypothetical protein
MNFAKGLVALVDVLVLVVFTVVPFCANTWVVRPFAVIRATAVTMTKIANVVVIFFLFIKSVIKLFFI